MNECEGMVLTFLKAGLWNHEVSVDQSFDDWNGLVREARRQSVLGIVAKAVLDRRDLQTRLPNDLRLRLKSFVVSNVMTSESMREIIVRVVQAMADAGIIPVLLKGHSLAVNYPFPDLRQCGDIDIYVGEESAVEAYQVLKTIATSIDPEDKSLWGKHFSAHFDEIEVEVHRHTSTHSTRRYAGIYAEAAGKGLTENLQTLSMGDVSVLTPSIDFNAYYIFDHLFEHFLTSGIGLRHLCDWMMYLHRYHGQLDLAYLKKLLADMDMLKPWQAFGGILVKYLGLPQEEFPFYAGEAKAGKLLRHILDDGNFGKDTAYYTRRSKNYIFTKLNALWCHVTRGARMFSIFPGQVVRHFFFVVSNYMDHLRADLKRRRNG